jgi:hypothetical protein
MNKLLITLSLISINVIAAGNYSPLYFTIKPKINKYVVTMVNKDNKTVNIQNLEIKKLGEAMTSCTKVKVNTMLATNSTYNVNLTKDIVDSCIGKFNSIKEDSIANPDKSSKLCMGIEYGYQFKNSQNKNYAFVPFVCK